MSDPTEREWLEGIGERFEREHEERMSDQLGEALARAENDHPDRLPPSVVRTLAAAARNWHALTQAEAARRFVDGWETCPTCNGSGSVRADDTWLDPMLIFGKPCPDCVDGMIPRPALVELFATAFAKFFETWCDEAPFWPTDDLMIHNHNIRDDAKAVLVASRREEQ